MTPAMLLRSAWGRVADPFSPVRIFDYGRMFPYYPGLGMTWVVREIMLRWFAEAMCSAIGLAIFVTCDILLVILGMPIGTGFIPAVFITTVWLILWGYAMAVALVWRHRLTKLLPPHERKREYR